MRRGKLKEKLQNKITSSEEFMIKSEKRAKSETKNIQKWPKVAIIILNWNGWKDTIECLESVFRNTYPNYQVVVVDNGSTDNSVERIKAWVAGKEEALTPKPNHPLYHLSYPPIKKPLPCICYYYKKEGISGNFKLDTQLTNKLKEKEVDDNTKINSTSYYQMKLIQNKSNLGFAGGNNVGIKYLINKEETDFIFLLNNDVVVSKDFLTPLIREMKSNENIGIIGPKIYYYNNHLKIYCAGCDLSCSPLKGIVINERGKGNIDKGQYNKVEDVGYISGCCLGIRKEIVKTVGLMDERFFLYFEDTDWILRIKQFNWRVIYTPKSKVWHKGSHTVGENNPFCVYYKVRNKLLLTHKVLKKKLWFTFYPLYLIKSIILSFQFLFMEKREIALIKVICLFDAHIDFLKGNYGNYKNIKNKFLNTKSKDN